MFRLKLSKKSLAVFVGLLFFISCTILQDSHQSDIEELSINSHRRSDFSDYQAFKTDSTSAAVLYVKADSCNSESPNNLTYRIRFKSVFKNHLAELKVLSRNKAIVSIDGQPSFSSEYGSINLFDFCTNSSFPTPQANEREKAKVFVVKLFEAFANDCNMNYSTRSGWSCQLNSQTQGVSSIKIQSVRKEVIRGSRQPYSLTRKIAFSEQLSKAIASPTGMSEKLKVICRLLPLSSSNAHPMSFTNRYARRKMCKESPNQKEAMLTVLAYATKEIESLKKLFRNHSKLGLIQIKIPRDKAPSKDIWVKIDSNDTSVQRKKYIDSQTTGWPNATAQLSSCWHPVFRKGRNLYAARLLNLNLKKRKTKSFCNADETVAEKDKTKALDAIMLSISSETEFVVSNGNAKLLRLPKGSYRYIISNHSKLPEADRFKEKVESKGDFKWTRRRPSVVIKRWL